MPFVSNVRNDQDEDYGIDEPTLVCPTLNFQRVCEEGPDGPSLDQLAMEAYRAREAFNQTAADPTLNSGPSDEQVLIAPTLNFSIKGGKMVGEASFGSARQFTHFAPPPSSSTVPQHREKKPYRPALGPSGLQMQDEDEDDDDFELPAQRHEPRDHAGNLIVSGDEDTEELHDPLTCPTIWADSIWKSAKIGRKAVGPR